MESISTMFETTDGTFVEIRLFTDLSFEIAKKENDFSDMQYATHTRIENIKRFANVLNSLIDLMEGLYNEH